MSELVVVSTCPRVDRGGEVVDYLPGTLERLHAAGAEHRRKVVLSDGPLRRPCPWPVRVRAMAARSSRANLWCAFRFALELGAERLLFFEDDVVPCARAVERMATLAIPADAALVSFFDAMPARGPCPSVHLAPVDERGFWGLCAVAIPRRALEYFTGHDPFALRTGDTSCGGDLLVGELVARSPWPRIAHHLPSLVRHVGAVSAAHRHRWGIENTVLGAPPHLPPTYPGDGFDAMSLCQAESDDRRAP